MNTTDNLDLTVTQLFTYIHDTYSECQTNKNNIPGSRFRSGWLPKNFIKFFLVHRYICGKIFKKIRSVVFTYKVANRQTDRQTNAGHYITYLADVITIIPWFGVLLIKQCRNIPSYCVCILIYCTFLLHPLVNSNTAVVCLGETNDWHV